MFFSAALWLSGGFLKLITGEAYGFLIRRHNFLDRGDLSCASWVTRASAGHGMRRAGDRRGENWLPSPSFFNEFSNFSTKTVARFPESSATHHFWEEATSTLYWVLLQHNLNLWHPHRHNRPVLSCRSWSSARATTRRTNSKIATSVLHRAGGHVLLILRLWGFIRVFTPKRHCKIEVSIILCLHRI